MMAAVSISGISIGFGPVTVIDDLSLDIPASTTFGIVGESGSGKTTVLRAALGLQEVRRGEIRLMGERFGTSLAETRRAGADHPADLSGSRGGAVAALPHRRADGRGGQGPGRAA